MESGDGSGVVPTLQSFGELMFSNSSRTLTVKETASVFSNSSRSLTKVNLQVLGWHRHADGCWFVEDRRNYRVRMGENSSRSYRGRRTLLRRRIRRHQDRCTPSEHSAGFFRNPAGSSRGGLAGVEVSQTRRFGFCEFHPGGGSV